MSSIFSTAGALPATTGERSTLMQTLRVGNRRKERWQGGEKRVGCNKRALGLVYLGTTLGRQQAPR